MVQFTIKTVNGVKKCALNKSMIICWEIEYDKEYDGFIIVITMQGGKVFAIPFSTELELNRFIGLLD